MDAYILDEVPIIDAVQLMDGVAGFEVLLNEDHNPFAGEEFEVIVRAVVGWGIQCPITTEWSVSAAPTRRQHCQPMSY